MSTDLPIKPSASTVDQLLKFIAVASLCWGVWQYFDKQRTDTKKEVANAALSYISGFNNADLQSSYVGVGSFWRQKVDPVLRSGVLSESDQLRIYKLVIQTKPEYPIYDANVLRVLTHFDNVAFCTEAGLCDARIVERFYCEKIRVFTKLTTGDISYYRREGMNVGKETLAFLERVCLSSSTTVPASAGG